MKGSESIWFGDTVIYYLLFCILWMSGDKLAKLMTTQITAVPHFHNYPTFKAFHINMGGLYKMLLLWFPGNKPLHCDFLGDFVVNFHGCYYFSWVSSFLVKWCWLIKKKDGICTWAYFVEKRSQGGLRGTDRESDRLAASRLPDGDWPPDCAPSGLTWPASTGCMGSLDVVKMRWAGLTLLTHNSSSVGSWAAWNVWPLSPKNNFQ